MTQTLSQDDRFGGHPGAVLRDNVRIMISAGDVLQGRYRVVGLLGQGGMGAVYEAVDERLGNQVALKQCSFDRPDVLRQFEREARLLAGMRHSSVTRVIDHFVENGKAILAGRKNACCRNGRRIGAADRSRRG